MEFIKEPDLQGINGGSASSIDCCPFYCSVDDVCLMYTGC